MPDLEVTRLEADRLAMAYPLLRAAAQIPLEAWHAYGAALLANGGEIVVVTADSGCILGLVAFRRSDKLRVGKTIEVEMFEAFDLSASMPVRKALGDALEAIAQAEGCQAVTFRPARRKSPAVPLIRAGSRPPAERR